MNSSQHTKIIIMKRFLLLSSCLLTFLQIQAQSPSYVDFEWDVFRFGYALSSSDTDSGGLQFGGEVRYNATDNFSLGFGGNGTVFGTDFDGNVDVGVSGSSLILGDFYMSNTSATRGFLGVGLGLFSTGTVTISDGGVDEVVRGTTGFGVAPRAGFELNHIRLLGQYNITFKEGHSNYFGITVALTLWGGYKGNHSNNDNNNNNVRM